MLPLPSNSYYTREAFRKQNYTARTARNGGIDQSIRRSLIELPVAPQNYRESPCGTWLSHAWTWGFWIGSQPCTAPPRAAGDGLFLVFGEIILGL